MSDLMGLEEIERENRKQLFEVIQQIPEGIPTGWERKTLAVGGLMYVGFSETHTEHLVCISSQGQRLIDCITGEKRYVEELYDEDGLVAYTDGIESETIHIAGEGGGGLKHYSKDGNSLEKLSPIWPREQIVFMPDYCSWRYSPEKCWIVSDAFEIKTYGFNKTGNLFVIATSSDLTIYNRIEV